MTITTALTRLLGVEHPILLAPMGGVAGGRLAAAVSDAGGFGLIGGGYGDPDALRAEIELAGDARVGIGFITFALGERVDSLRIALERTPPAVQLSFGDPRPYADQIHESGALLICQIQTVAEAIRAAAAGADVIVAQGQDAGGHGRPARGTIGLVPAVVDRVGSIPVVAAGGLADGRGLAAALMLGAAGVTLGTRLYAATEAISDATAAAMLASTSGDDTVRTPLFDLVRGPAWPAGHDARVIRNQLVERWDGHPEQLAQRFDQARSEFDAAAEDDYSVKPLWAGEGLDLIHEIGTAASIIARIIADATSTIAKSAQDLQPDR